MVKRPLEEENGQNLESICRAVKRLHTSSGSLSQQVSGNAQDTPPNQLDCQHSGAVQQQRPTAANGIQTLPSGRPPISMVTRPDWDGAGPSAAEPAVHAQQNILQPGDQGAAPQNAEAATARHTGSLQHQQDALQQQLHHQKLLHEQQYMARQQQQQQMQQQQGASPSFAGPSTPRQVAEEHAPPALLAHERAVYEAPNTLLKDLHFERLRRLTLADDDGPRTASRWHFR